MLDTLPGLSLPILRQFGVMLPRHAVVIIRDRLASRSSKLRRRQTRGLLEGMKTSFIQAHFVRLLLVQLKQSHLLGGELGIQHVEVRFVVQPDRSVIEVS